MLRRSIPQIVVHGSSRVFKLPGGTSIPKIICGQKIDDEGICHVGIDSFLAKVIGSVDKLTFSVLSGKHQPEVIITVKGVDFPMVFPNQMNITATNSHLRADPNRIATDPYTFGWLFEGVETKSPEEAGITHGLIHGKGARTWMQNETKKLSEFVHERFIGRSEDGKHILADGGTFGIDLTKNLNKEELLILYNEFFLSRP